MMIEAYVGEKRVSAGVLSPMRLGPYAEQIVNDCGFGRYFEGVRNRRIFHSMVKAVTIAATHGSPIAANTATPVLGFGNPSGSGKGAALLRVACGTISGTPAGGGFVINVQPDGQNILTASATGSIFSGLVQGGASAQGSAMKPYNNVALGGWLATPNAVEELLLVGQASAAAAAGSGGPGACGEDIGGLVIVPPGALCALMAGTGAGTSWIVNASWSWVEFDWPL